MAVSLLLALVLSVAQPVQRVAGPGPSSAPPPVAGSIHGHILESGGVEPVRGALVRVTGTGLDRVVITGGDGAFAFGGVPLGEYRVQVAHPGYAPMVLQVALRSEGDLMLLLPLDVRPIAVQPIEVLAGRDWSPPPPELARGRLTAPVLPGRIPVLPPQLAATMAYRIAGDALRDPVADRGAGRHGHALHVWGSSEERGRVLVDGATLNAPMHLGGMLPPLDAELLAGAELRTGGISPRFDGGTTYIMDFSTRPASDGPVRSGGELDPLTTRIGFESPLGAGSSVAVVARRVNSEAVDLLLGDAFGYGYGDFLGRVDRGLAGGRLHGTFVGTRESIVLPRDQAEDEASWRNVAGTLAWRGTGSGGVRTAILTFSRGSAGLPLLSAPAGRTTSTVDRLSALWEEQRPLGRARGSFGFEVERVVFSRRNEAFVPWGGGGGEELRSCVPDLPCFRATADQVAGFAELSGMLGGRVLGRVGARVAWRPGGEGMDLLPRVSLSRELEDRTILTLSAGRFSQVHAAVSPVAGGDVGSDSEPSLSLEARAEVSRATQVEALVERNLGSSALSASVFLHRHDRHGLRRARTVPGMEVGWGYAGERVSGSIGYSFSGAGRGVGVEALYERDRHLAVADLLVQAGSFAFQLGGAWGRGLPFTSIALEHPAEPTGVDRTLATPYLSAGWEGQPDPSSRPHLRLDGAASMEREVRMFGRSVVVSPYVRILNALSHRDALFHLHDEREDGVVRPLATLPAIPVLGVRWAF